MADPQEQPGLEASNTVTQHNPWIGFNNTLKTFVSGGVAGCCAKSITAPVDRLKILYQAKNEHYARMRMNAGFFAIWKKEGPLAYFKGNGAMMARVFPYAAIQFTSYEQYKKILMGMPQVGPLNQIASGSLAGMTAVVLTYPLDLIRARLVFQVHTKHYRGITHALRKIYREEHGVRGLYRGFLPTIIGMIPYGGVAFYTYETFKHIFLEHLTALSTEKEGKKVLTVTGSLLCGASSGLLSQFVSYPLDVVRRRIQLSTASTHEHGWWRTLFVVYQQDGVVRGLYRGLSLNFIRVVPQVAVSFMVYEQMKQFFGLHKAGG